MAVVDHALTLGQRAISFVGTRTVGKDFNDLMALGCDLVHRFEQTDAVCLTFDDGPNPRSTLRLLEMLDRYKIKATFFCVGTHAQRHPEIARRLVEAGHEIANHSMSHCNLLAASPWRLWTEVDSAQRALQAICNVPITLFRAPYGRFRWDLRRFRNDLRFIKWDVGPAWDDTDPGRIAQYILARTRAGSIIILHDGLAKVDRSLSDAAGEAAIHTLPLIVPSLQARGLRFATVSEVLSNRARGHAA